MAESNREISVAEFFVKNRHLLGFDNPLKALLTTVKEGVDNALDACEEAGILPDVTVEITRASEIDDAEAMAADVVCGFTGEVKPNGNGNGNGNGKPQEDAGAAGGRAAAAGLFQRSLFDAEPELSEEQEAAEAVRKSDRKAAATRGRGVAAPPEAYVVAIQDNGPGIVATHVGKIFGKLLYGSKFHRLRQSRGQQGIGISAAGMYGQLTTGKPVRIISRTDPKDVAHYFELSLDVQRNQPEIRTSDTRSWEQPRGTRVVIELEAKHQRGKRSVDTYLRATALANPHATLRYRDPDHQWTVYERATDALPEEPREVKPHPYGVELGMLLQMLKTTQEKKLGSFLQKEFSRVSRKAAHEICDHTSLNPTTWLARVAREDVAELHAALGKVKLMSPPTDCISPIGEGLLIDSLAREYPDAFLKAVTRSPSVYRGNPFQVEVALAHGRGIPSDGAATLLRFANRVPLLYQHGACAISKSVMSAPWRNYGVEQSRGAMPGGPMVLVVHVASVWVPFTSESKEAVAHYPEILKEIRLAVMDCGRALGRHVKAQKRMADAVRKRDYIAKYIPKISEALQGILEFDDEERDSTTATLRDVLDRSRKL
jgi:DNA topoisomerase-6 subunit B